MSLDRRAGWFLLTIAFVAVMRPSPLPAQQAGRGSSLRLLAQQERTLDRPTEDVLRLPALKVFAPARLPESLLPLSSIPSAIQIVPGDDLSQSGTPDVQEYLTRLPGVSLNDEQGNAAQPDLALRGFQVTSVTGVPQGVSV